MRRIAILAFAAALAAASHSADMASQKWVEMRMAQLKEEIGGGAITGEQTKAWIIAAVSNAVNDIVGVAVDEAVSNSLAITKAISPLAVDAGTNGMVYATFEPASEYALFVTNSLNAIITNGTLFAYLNNGVYTNAQIGGAVVATTSNFVWNATMSTLIDDVDTFSVDNGFSILLTFITPTDAAPLKGE